MNYLLHISHHANLQHFVQIPILIDDKSTQLCHKTEKCTCTDCGKDSEVPFEPKAGRPVYCRECLPKHRSRRF